LIRFFLFLNGRVLGGAIIVVITCAAVFTGIAMEILERMFHHFYIQTVFGTV